MNPICARAASSSSYLRTWALDSLPKFAASLPIAPALRLAGPLLQQANLWLGDGGLHSAVHFDDRDNLMLQLSGSKEVLLLPPTLLERLGYEPREERRFKSGPSLAAGPLSTTSPTGRTPVENHSPFQPFAVGLGGSTREEEEGAAHDAQRARPSCLSAWRRVALARCCVRSTVERRCMFLRSGRMRSRAARAAPAKRLLSAPMVRSLLMMRTTS